jgi:hypothetical protein
MGKKHKLANINYRKIYESYYGKIPKGHHIHHIDGDPFNNDISNLKCVSAEEHSEIHKNEFTKWASIGGKIGGSLARDLKIGIHGATKNQKTMWAKNASKYVDRKKLSMSLKEGYESGKIVHWTKRYSKEEVSKKISEGDPGKSKRGKTAWNKGIVMVLKDKELANKRKSEAAKNKKRVQCPHCDRVIDISNINKHIVSKHKT